MLQQLIIKKLSLTVYNEFNVSFILKRLCSHLYAQNCCIMEYALKEDLWKQLENSRSLVADVNRDLVFWFRRESKGYQLNLAI